MGYPWRIGMTISPVHVRVQEPGSAWRIGSAAFRRELARTPTLRDCVNRYIFVIMTQLMRNAGCNRFPLRAGSGSRDAC
jgi:hypothetical protein